MAGISLVGSLFILVLSYCIYNKIIAGYITRQLSGTRVIFRTSATRLEEILE